MEWDCLMETQGGNQFVLGVHAFSEGEAKAKAKKLSKGCKVLGIKPAKKDTMGAGTSLLKGESNTLPI